jgi:hypothetical protein
MDASRNAIQKKRPRTAMSGRRPAHESRATELRRKLIERERTPESSRPSLRALARELDTSHQLLAFYLKGLGEWQCEEYLRQAREIRARATAENRFLTPREEQQARSCDRTGFHVIVHSLLLDDIKRMKKDSEQRLLCRQEIKALKMFARDFPEAQELLQKCLRDGVMKRKPFEEIVKETTRQKGETYIAWVRRVWDECAKYDTKCPTVITEELLEEYSHGSAKSQKKNLPVSSSRAGKSFG